MGDLAAAGDNGEEPRDPPVPHVLVEVPTDAIEPGLVETHIRGVELGRYSGHHDHPMT